MRADIGNGQWAEITERMTWAQKNRVRDSAGGEGDFYSGFITTLCKTLVTEWSLDLPLDDTGWAAIDADTGDAIVIACMKVWTQQPDPKGTALTPSDSPPA